MYRTHTCGELRDTNINDVVILSGWIQKVRKLGAMTFIDLRDRYGITQLVVGENSTPEIKGTVNKLSREFVIQAKGKVIKRSNLNKKITTGDIEISVESIKILSKSETPPFTIEDNTDGGDEIRMKYRYLDLRRNCVRKNLELRHRLAHIVRNYMDNLNFMEVETPVLIKSTPEGARDFVVPSRMNQGEFYALPQSPQTFKQLLMVAGFDRYYQIVKCFRDEDLRADRQPEFTQIDCEMSFVEQEDVLDTFEGLAKKLFKDIRNLDLPKFPRLTWHDAMKYYGSDKPDIRFDMRIADITKECQKNNFKVFDNSEYVGTICAHNCSKYTRKQIDQLTEFVKRPQVGAKGLVYVRYNADGTFKSSVDKFFDKSNFKVWAEKCNAKPGDLLLILSGLRNETLVQLGTLRLEMAKRLELLDKFDFKEIGRAHV